ncbi:MAG: hypothetical protein ACD_63C00041G0004 [uncultured bacterium]|nr:MAG: hypothetical protein ACD_63C00041G0004 [uncultured bacterium]
MTDEINLTYPFSKKQKKGKKGTGFFRKKSRTILVIIAIFVIYIIGSLFSAKAAYDNAMDGKEYLLKVQDAVAKQDLKTAEEEIKIANRKMQTAKWEFTFAKWTYIIPIYGKQARAAGNLLDAGALLTSALSKTISSGLEILSPIQSKEITNFGELSSTERGEALEKFSKSEKTFEKSKDKIGKAKKKLENIDNNGVNEKIVQAKNLIIEKIPIAENFLEEALLAAKILPRIAGHPDEQQYLFVSQNPHELRNSGGFIGNVGILKVHEGDIAEFTTKGVYNLDKEAPVPIEPPAYIKTYLKMPSWYLRDANMCVGCADFAVASEKILEIYKIETGLGDNLNGVISITPVFLEDLLKITGPVQVEGYPYTFTAENATETIQVHVEEKYKGMGIPMEDRQSIVSDLSNVILKKIFALPKEKWFDVVKVLKKAFEQKHAMMYVRDKKIQEILREEGWTCEMNNNFDQDYLLVADNNVAALKTDRVMDRVINYEIDISNQKDIRAKLQITYINNGTFSNYTTRHRTWTQVYVPHDAELLSYDGTEVTDKQTPKGEMVEEIDPHSGRKVWSYFKSTEPGDMETVNIEYKLPSNIIKKDVYRLLVQKQAGTPQHKLNFTVKSNTKPKMVTPADVSKIQGSMVYFDTDLLVDREFDVEY